MQMFHHQWAVALATAVLVVLINEATAETVYEAIGRQRDLSKFMDLINRDEVLQKLLQQWPVTVFAPIDAAIQKNQQWISGKEGKIVSYHVLNLVANKSSFPFTTPTSLAGAPPVYLGSRIASKYWTEKEYFVNNAKIIRTQHHTSQSGNGQALYVIDELLKPYFTSSSALPPDAFKLMQKPQDYDIPESLSAFESRVRDEGLQSLFQREGNHTFFIPIGRGSGQNSHLKQQVDAWVVRGHIIPKNVIFTRLAGQENYPSDDFNDDIKVELSIVNETNPDSSYSVYAQSNTVQSKFGHKKGVVLSKIIRPNIPVKNGVVHLIDSPLMVIDITVWKFIDNEKHARLSEFHDLINYSPDFKKLLTSDQEKTLFAPSNDAIRQLPHEVIESLKRNITALTKLLRLHLVLSSISSEDVFLGRHLEYLSANEHNSLKLRVSGMQHNKTLIVEGNGVKATSTQPDIGAVDGMIHIVDRLLGLPYQTIFHKLEADPDLRITYNLGEQDGWRETLDSHERRFTFFAPSNDAWAYIRHNMPTEYKQLTSGSVPYHVHKILDRHVVVGKEIKMEDLVGQYDSQMIHGIFKIRRVEVSGEAQFFLNWEGVEARIVKADLQAVNGIVHIIDHVMMKKRDLTKSSAPLCVSSAVLLCLATLASFWRAL